MMTNRSGRGVSTLMVAASLFASGCGVGVDVFAPPNVLLGQNAQIQIKLTRYSACPILPLGFPFPENVFLIPFVPQSEVDGSILGEICALDAGLSNNFDIRGLSQQAAGATTWQTAANAVGLTSQATTALSCDTGTCSTMGGEIGCIVDMSSLQNVGDMLTITCTAMSQMSGPTQSIALALVTASGVCAGAADNGKGCLSDGDCSSNSCLPGICSNNGLGCSVDGDCGAGTCTQCVNPSQFPAAAGVGCAASVVAPAAAPVVSWKGLVALAVCLFAVAAFGLRRYRIPSLRRASLP